MILKALYDYYQRLKAIDASLPATGFKEQEIPFLIVINEDGNFIRIEDRRIDKKISQKFTVVADSRSSGIKPYLMYDNLEYTLCYTKDGKQNKSLEKHKAFVAQCKDLANKYPACKDFYAVAKFYENNGVEKVQNDDLWDDMIKKTGANISFLLQGNTNIAASAPELSLEIYKHPKEVTIDSPCCLITGKKGEMVDITTSTMIPGSQATAKLVAFQVNSGYDSYGKSQGSNAPISKEAESAYSTALLRLLGKQSKNKFLVGDRTFVFWASSPSKSAIAAEKGLYDFLGFSEEKDNPNKRIEEVYATFNAIYSGQLQSNSDDRFYILGLAPNAARIAVVYWNEISVRDFAGRILKHFQDMEIYNSIEDTTKTYCALRQMMASVTQGGKSSEVQKNLPEATIKSIFEGIQYPFPLMTAAIRRIRAEQKSSMQITRVAIIKAFLNRQHNNQIKIKNMLDISNINAAYVCGRLFALLEYTQKRANNINTIKERYMNAASATPAMVFPTLLNLNVHHLEKLDGGARHYLETIKQEVFDLLPADGFPSRFDLNDQGRFFIGYYHQMQSLYNTKKENN